MLALAALLLGCGRPNASPTPAEVFPWHHVVAAPPPASQGAAATVVDIVDGDTIRVRLNERTITVRLLGIDTPEKAGGPRPAECFGAEATAFAAALIPVDSAVELHRDLDGRDQYGRTLAWVHRPDGVFVNLAMVESGHASALFFPPNDALEPLFTDAEHYARREWIGFWPSCGAADVTLDAASGSS